MKQLLLLLSILLCTTYSSYAGSEKDIKTAMQEYADALKNKDGDAVLNCVTKSSYDFFGDMLMMVKNFDDQQISELDTFIQDVVNKIKYNIEPIALREINTGKELLKYVVDNDVYRDDLIIFVGIRYINIEGNFARAKIYYRNTVYNVFYHFYFEDGKWRFDIPQLIDAKKSFATRLADYFGITKNQAKQIIDEEKKDRINARNKNENTQ